jgi:mono/diheme cytochrome c family protein
MKSFPPKRYMPIALAALFFSPLTETGMAATAHGQDSRYDGGTKLFERYCSKCHGEKADGNGRMARLYRKLHTQLPTNFTLGIYAERTGAYLRQIITQGGEANRMSHFMPPFGQELSPEDIDELVYFIQKTPELTGYPRERTHD